MRLPLVGYSPGRLLLPKLYRQITNSKERTKHGTGNEKTRSRLRVALATKIDVIVEWYEALLKRYIPPAFAVHRSLSTGTKLFYNESRICWNVRRRLSSGYPIGNLSRRELEIYHRIPNDIVHVAPILVIVAFPLTGWIIFPLLYFFPKQLLCPQFWSSSQLRRFEVERHLNRVKSYDSVLELLERSRIKDQHLQTRSLELITALRSGKQPSVREILKTKPLYTNGGNFALQNLGYTHLRALSHSHGIRFASIMPYKRLQRFGGLLLAMDRRLAEESIAQLTEPDLQQCCFTRGFNPVGLSREESEQYLDRWLQVSLELRDREVSLLLHAPIFLAYNHKNNHNESIL